MLNFGIKNPIILALEHVDCAIFGFIINFVAIVVTKESASGYF